MRHEIILAPHAVEDLGRLSARDRSTVLDAIERHLRYEPQKPSRSRIKVLPGIDRPQYRLRIGDLRVFYDVNLGTVEILAIVAKAEASQWLEQYGGKK